jgi:ATP adenylyltransferase
MAYITAEHSGRYGEPSCIFCDLAARDDDARTYILHRGGRAFVIMNLYPYMMVLARRAQAVLEDRMRPQGFNIGINQGRAAGAGIADHLHMHVLPRWVGDTNFMPALGDVRVMPQHLDETYALLVDGFAE